MKLLTDRQTTDRQTHKN